jgi:hypothetical protein
MAGNHLEAIVAEWYEFRGFFVRRNVQVEDGQTAGMNANSTSSRSIPTSAS